MTPRLGGIYFYLNPEVRSAPEFAEHRYLSPASITQYDGHTSPPVTTVPLCLAFKARKFSQARELREAIAAGADLRDERNRRLQPLGQSSIAKVIGTLAAILDEAGEDDHISPTMLAGDG